MYYLAEVNISRVLAPLNDPQLADFVTKLEEVHQYAEHSPGFVWRYRSPKNANSVRTTPFDDVLIQLNMSVWRSREALLEFIYSPQGLHHQVMKERQRWFAHIDGPFIALWWIPQGHLPTIEEAKERLAYLRMHGETPYAFSFRHFFPAPDEAKVQ
ncbi:DUF3291 domain-containing protein [Tengunoibacter tsumagoiensis]|uniref:DUF3291 domain-containing protein n=1 Tax=Tengunoibacter tsumagoiensis TaxID=2014871 RepID=A0A402A2D5_9CHLR|nr:DUF3291 domain-containing protein [Tengunoibacter tsumagoiensis]GCE13216.1 hypothetical protein KTT_30750 [Tengunoibacter tsumagoiensis]